MNQLVSIKTMSSREIADITGKQHKNVLSDCDKLNENYRAMGLAEISAGVYTHPNTGSQKHREYLLDRMQCFDLMTGYSVPLRIKVNRRWEELEKKEQFQLPQSFSEALRLAAEKAEEAERLQLRLEEQRPDVLFAESFKISESVILVGDMAKLLRQKGVDIGEHRLYNWLVENKYLICRKRWSTTKKKYTNDYMPTQRAADLNIFFVIERPIPSAPGEPPFIKHTCKITGKGQIYFVNKFLNKK